ncbi:hypothetical protein CL621_03545 [archaeon]|nr:hypothetical protein [archaeon]|tara:strand:+ start:4402 stop:4962 length:561 start_codon:yes stop_codon:yes gene_type:complete
MNNTLIFLRHAKTKIDKSIPISDWILTKEGMKEAKNIANISEFQDIDVIISSGEKKAYDTIKHLAKKLNKKIIQINELNELKRLNGETLSSEEYEKMKVKIFEDLAYTDHGWETSKHALNRFKKAVEKIDEKYKNKKILIVAHGTVMTLYFASLQNKLDELMERWKKLDTCDWGIVKNNKVIKEIV